MFRGIASVTMDSRGRMALPSRFREEAEQRTENRLVATIDTNEQCLLLYSLGDWEEVQLRLEALSNIGTSARLLQRLLIGHATDVEMDAQGRVLIPPMLREYGELEKKIVLMGQTNKLEIWSEQIWRTRREEWLKATRKTAFSDLGDLDGLSV